MSDRPTVDDLLVRLRTSGWFLSAVVVAPGDSAVVTLRRDQDGVVWRRGRVFRQPTLFAALDEAVHAIEAP